MTRGEKPCPPQLTCCQGHFKPRRADYMQVRISMTTAVCPGFRRIGENTDSSLLGVGAIDIAVPTRSRLFILFQFLFQLYRFNSASTTL